MGVVTWREVRWIGSGNGSLQNRLQERRGRKISEVMVEVEVRSRTNTASSEFNRGNMIIFNIDKKVITRIYCKKKWCFIYKSPKGNHLMAQTKFPNVSVVH